MEISVMRDYRAQDLERLPITELVRFVLRREGCPENTEVAISFVEDEVIACLNEHYRGKTGPTDVLSFECDGASGFFGEDGFEDTTPDEESSYVLGDIVIAVDVAERQTREFRTSFEEEISILLVHGLLHLCGYDHIEDDEAEVMEARESELLSEWMHGK